MLGCYGFLGPSLLAWNHDPVKYTPFFKMPTNANKQWNQLDFLAAGKLEQNISDPLIGYVTRPSYITDRALSVPM